jgi:hypothetical protein
LKYVVTSEWYANYRDYLMVKRLRERFRMLFNKRRCK